MNLIEINYQKIKKLQTDSHIRIGEILYRNIVPEFPFQSGTVSSEGQYVMSFMMVDTSKLETMNEIEDSDKWSILFKFPLPITKETVSIINIAIRPQFVNNKEYIDFYWEPYEETDNFLVKDIGRDAMFKYISAYFMIFDYVQNEVKKEKHKFKKYMNIPKLNKGKHKSYNSKPIVLNKNISIQYVYEPHESRKSTRHCESWGVIGHYRHYKSGKTIYIKPYKKGKGRLKVTEYTYE